MVWNSPLVLLVELHYGADFLAIFMRRLKIHSQLSRTAIKLGNWLDRINFGTTRRSCPWFIPFATAARVGGKIFTSILDLHSDGDPFPFEFRHRRKRSSQGMNSTLDFPCRWFERVLRGEIDFLWNAATTFANNDDINMRIEPKSGFGTWSAWRMTPSSV